MENIRNMPAVSIIVIFVILALFAAAVILLFSVCAAYRRELRLASNGDSSRSRLLQTALDGFIPAYKEFGQETNTPAIITGAINSKMGFALFCERFLANAVSLFVTLGLFGTFLGLSMSVASLTELISGSNTSDWLSVLDSVGDGLMSALSGMGVAFYTSLVGVACSILLTVLRAIFSPEKLRSSLETEMELWLDHRTAPTLQTDRAKDDAEIVNRMIYGMNTAASSMEKTLKDATASMQKTLENSCVVLKAFNSTVDKFNQGTRDFSEFDYNLRGTVERMDVAVRDLGTHIRTVNRKE